jgi:hypothetical protein
MPNHGRYRNAVTQPVRLTLANGTHAWVVPGRMLHGNWSRGSFAAVVASLEKAFASCAA